MDLGDTLPFRTDVYNEEGGVLTNASAAVLTVTLPDGTTATPTVSNPATGKYAVDYQTTLASPQGRYVGQWLVTFPGGATTSYVESFDVGLSLVTVDEALAHLAANNIITSASDLEQLQWLCIAATDAVERDLDRVLVPRTIVETHDGGSAVVLRKFPVLSVVSVTQNGSATSEFLPNLTTGILYQGSGYAARGFGSGFQNITVTYRAGETNPPPVVRKVALDLIQSGWQSSQQAPHPALSEFNEQDVAGVVASMPRVEQRAYDSLRVSGVA